MTLKYVNLIMWGPKQSMNICLLFIHLDDTLKFGWSCRFDIIHNNHCVILVLFTKKSISIILKLLTLSIIFLLLILALFIICANVNIIFFF